MVCCLMLLPRRCAGIAANPKHVDARIGATWVLPNLGLALTHHPHSRHTSPICGIEPMPTAVACKSRASPIVRVTP